MCAYGKRERESKSVLNYKNIELQHEKMYIQMCTSEDSEQSVHLHNLISLCWALFVLPNIWSFFKTNWPAQLIFLVLALRHMANGTFSHIVVILLSYMWWAMYKKGPYAICRQRRAWSACAFAQADLDLRCPLTESADTEVYVDEQKMPRSDCTDAQADLDLRCPQLYKGLFTCAAHHV